MKTKRSRRSLLLPAVLAAALGVVQAARAQSGGPGASFDPDDRVSAGAGLDSIDPYNGSLSIAVPIGPAYSVGPGLDFQMRLYYSSRVWAAGEWQYFPPSCSPSCTAEPNILLDGDPALGLGWRLGFGSVVEAAAGVPAAYLGPDGSAHRLYNRRFFSDPSPDPNGFYYTRDNTYLRVKYLGSGSGYKMWTPDGNATTFAQNVKGFDDNAGNYVSDYGRGRDGWHATRIENPYADAITISYQSAGPATPNAWVPSTITIPSIGGSGTRTISVNMNGGARIANIQVRTFNGATSTYTLNHSQGNALPRAFPHPTPSSIQPWYLDRVDLPMSGYSRSFTYYETGVASPYGAGTMASQTVPTGARVDYDYRTWTWYHANPLNRPGPPTCVFPPAAPPSRPTLTTGPGIEPTLTHPGTDCWAADRAAGVVQRTVTYSTLNAPDTATTKYYQVDYPRGESGSDTSAQTLTAVVSPPDVDGDQHSTSYLFPVSTDDAVSGPLVGALKRVAVYSGDLYARGLSSDTSLSLRVQRLAYDSDSFDPDPTSAASESFEANRRVIQSTTFFWNIGRTAPPSGKYHQIDYVFDANAGRHTKETHSGTIASGTTGTDVRQIQTDWSPQIDTTHWKLDRAGTVHVRAVPGVTDFSTTTNLFDAQGFPTTTTISDGNGYGSLAHTIARDGHGFPSSETHTHGGSSYTRTTSFKAGTLATSQWSGAIFKSADNQVDSGTGEISSSTNPSGLTTSYTYDALGRPVTTTPPGGDAATTTTYPDSTHVKSVTSSGSTEYAWVQTTTDSLGRPIKLQRKLGGTAVSKQITRYDRQGHVVFRSEWVADSVNDASASGTSFTNYDDFGRARTITRADGKTTTVSYADGGSNPDSVWLATVTVAGVGGGNAVIKYRMDGFGNLVQVTETPDGSTTYDTKYTYDAQDRLIRVDQGNGGQIRTFTYDAFGFLRNETVPERKNQTVTYGSYDAMGNVLSETQPGSVTVTRTYDAAGRMKTLAANSQTYLVNDYDGQVSCQVNPDGCPNGGAHGVGKLTRQTGYNPQAAPAPNAAVKQDFFYDDRNGRLSSRETRVYNGSTFLFATQTEAWTYDLVGNVLKYRHPRASGSFVVDTAFDHGMPVTVRANGLPVATGVTYQPSGVLASYVVGDGAGTPITVTIGADPNSLPRPASISTSGASPNFSSGSYTYDGMGNVTNIGTDVFGYDRMARLVSSDFGGGNTQGFQYDQYGNLKQTTGVNSRTYGIDARYNQLNGTGASYDARGNLLSPNAVENYTWDSLNRSVRFQAPSSVDWKYLYAGSSERLAKVPICGGPTHTDCTTDTSGYVWTLRDDANRVATEYLGAGITRDNVYLGGLLVGSYASCAVNGAPAWTYYAVDHLGSPRLIAASSGSAVEQRKYFPYGDDGPGSGIPAQRLRFASMERDSEGSRYYDHARAFDFQSVGRFLSLDPGTPRLLRPQTWNRYSYVAGNPATFVDPSGLEIVDIGSTVSVGGVDFHFTVLAGGVEDFWGAGGLAPASKLSSTPGDVPAGVPAPESLTMYGAFWEFPIEKSGSVNEDWDWHLAWSPFQFSWPFQNLTREEMARRILIHAAELVPFREPDYYSLNFSLGWNRASVGYQVGLDRYGHFYASDSPSLAGGPMTPGFGVSASAGFLDGFATPTESQMRSFMEGSSFTVMAGYGVSLARTQSGSVWATEIGASSPQVSVGRSSARQLDTPRLPVGR